jgi:hypothetical protein
VKEVNKASDMKSRNLLRIILTMWLLVPLVLHAQDKWYKGNIHTHTNASDGQHPLDQVINTYKSLKYDFLVISDHNMITPCANLSSSSFLLIEGDEISGNDHWGAVNLKSHFNYTNLSRQGIIDQINAQGALPILNHPRWAWIYFSVEDVLALNSINHMEIYNALTDGWSYTPITELWDGVLTAGRLIFGVGADDYHDSPIEGREYVGRSWIMVRSSSLQTDAIMAAIKRGDFYVSTGANFSNISYANNRITVSVVNGTEINFIGKNGVTLKTVKAATATYDVIGNEGYVRIGAFDRSGFQAYSQPVVFFGAGRLAWRLAVSSGNKQSATVAQTLVSPLVAKLSDGSNNPVANERVLFKVTSGGANFSGKDTLSVLTDSNGLASVRPTLGTVAGDSNQVFKVTVRDVASEATFKASATAAAAAKLTLVSGNNQSGPAGQNLAAPLVAKVTDSYDNAKSGIPITFAVQSGGGSVNSQTTTTVATAANGQAQVTWKVGAGSVEQKVRATAADLANQDIIYSATASSKPARLSLVSGNNQSAKVGQALAAPLVVSVVDSMGMNVSGQSVLFEVTTGGGKINNATSYTGATGSNGQVSVAWTLGTAVGTQTVSVSSLLNGKKLATTPTPLIFTATAVVEAAVKLVKVDGDGQSGIANHGVAKKLVIQVLDSYNNPISSQKVLYRIKTGKGAISENQPLLTAADGKASATWVLGPILGSQSLEVLVDGSQLSPVTFSATATKSVPKSIEIVSGQGQNGQTTVILDSLIAVLRDDAGGPVQGYPVSFSLGSGCGSLLTMNPDTTDGRGYATMRYRPANALGVHTIRATSPDLNQSVDFTATIQTLPNISFPLTIKMSDVKPANYQVDLLTAGMYLYVDRTYVISPLADTLKNMYVIKTGNNDKTNTSESFMTMTLDQPADIYVAYDLRVSKPPSWLTKNFKQTGSYLVSSDKSTQFTLWYREVLAGSVVLGGNSASGFTANGSFSMYITLVRRRPFVDRTPPAPPQGLVVWEVN